MISYVEMAKKRTYEYVEYSNFFHVLKDIQYGDIERERLDIFLPEKRGPFPAVIHVTGGGFVYGDKSMKKMEETFQSILSHGYAIVSVNYSLSDKEKYPVQIWQVKRAIRFIKLHAAEYGIDPEHLFLYGNSAGGYLVLMASFTDSRDSFFNGDYSNGRAGDLSVSTTVQGVVSIYALVEPYDCGKMIRAVGNEPKYYENTLESPEGYFFGDDIDNIRDKAKEASVLNYVREDHPPVLVQHGRCDRTVSPKNSYDLVTALLECNEENVEFEYFEGLDHSDPFFKSRENTERILSFFDKYL